MKRVTMAEVAKVAGVSKSTVSRVLNGHFEHVGERTRRRVLQVVEELNYRPNQLAASLRTKTTQMVAIIVPSIRNHLYTAVVRGVDDVLKQASCNLILCNADEDSQQERRFVEDLLSKGCDGFIVATAGGNEQLYQQLWTERVPVVLVDRHLDEVDYDAVVVDNRESIDRAVSRLLAMGHRRIACMVFPPEGISPRVERIAGYRDACLRYGVSDPDEWVIVVPPEEEQIRARLRSVLRGDPRPTALVTANALLTTQALHVIKELGLDIPADLSLLCYDEPEWAPYIAPPLSTIAQPVYDLGVEAAHLLLRRMRRWQPGRRVVLQTNLHMRSSCAPPQNPSPESVSISSTG